MIMRWAKHPRYTRVATRQKGMLLFLVTMIGLLCAAGCGGNMTNDSKLKPYEANSFFPNDQSARPLEPNTVARGDLRADDAYYTGKVNGQLVTTIPVTVTRALLLRGEERFNIYCSPCHSRLGDGNGMIVQRGFTPPPSFHTDRLRQAPIGHFFDVITNGYGVMYSYASRVPVADRWAIAAYIRALQLSQDATLNDVPPNERQQLTGK